jgi:polysaccharide biosynthesis transport protein
MTTLPVTIQDRMPMPVNVPARPGPVAPGLTANDIFRALRQRIFLILTCWILISGIAVGATWYLQQNHPSYEAKTYIQVESPFPRTPMVMGENPVGPEMMNRYVADQAVLIKDEQVLREALQDSAVLATAWHRNQPDKQLILEVLKEELGVAQLTGTSYLSVSFSAKDPKDAATVVNTIIDKYLAKVKNMSELQLSTELEGYKAQEAALAQKFQQILDEKQRFIKDQLGAPGLTEGLNVVGETLRGLANQVSLLEQEKLQAKAAYDNLIGVDPSQIAISPQMMAMMQNDPQIMGLQQNKFQLEQHRLTAMQEFGENHRSVQTLATHIKVIDEQLQEMMDKKEREVREYQINSAHTQFLNAMQAEMALRDRMLEAEAKQRDLDQGLARYRNLEDQQELYSAQLNQIRDYTQKLGMVIGDREKVRVKRIGPAIPPLLPSFPRWGVLVPGGSILGLLLGIGLALLIELMDTSVRTSRDVVKHVHVPILGTVPDLDDEEVPIERIELAAHSAPRSMVAEAFRAIRTNLLLSSPAERQRTVLVTSSRPEEGKTTVAINLAISVGQSGRRVLLVDANFHRPALHNIFNKSQNEGLSNALIGQASLSELARTTDLPNLDVITSGPIPPNPTELLASPYLQELITQASAQYDQIIFDGPPVLLVSDALVLAGVVHGTILVCRAKATSRGVIQRAREQLERVNAHIFGAILNAARVRRGGYFREQIRDYYDYQPEEDDVHQTRALPHNGEKERAYEV